MARLCALLNESEIPAQLILKPTAARYHELRAELYAMAKSMGITVIKSKHAKSKLGSYHDGKRKIFLNERVGMSRSERLFVLAHEVRHAIHVVENLFDARRFYETYYFGELMARAGHSFGKETRRRERYFQRILDKLKLDPMNPYQAELDCDRWAFHWLLRKGIYPKESIKHVYRYTSTIGSVIVALTGRDGITENTDRKTINQLIKQRPHDRLEARERLYYKRVVKRLKLDERIDP